MQKSTSPEKLTSPVGSIRSQNQSSLAAPEPAGPLYMTVSDGTPPSSASCSFTIIAPSGKRDATTSVSGVIAR